MNEEWFKEASDQTLDSLPQFISHLMNDYVHDYSSICHAIAASAIAAAYAADNTPQGGITGFQASAIMWDFIKHWMYRDNTCGLKLVNYDNMLYPQYDYKFEKTISEEVWRSLQAEAKKNLEDATYAHISVRAHWKSIVDGKVPFGYKVENKGE